MKKTLSFLFILILVCNLFSCGNTNDTDITEDIVSDETSEESVETSENKKPERTLDQTYHKKIEPDINGNAVSQNADKVVLFYVDDNMYSRDGVPSNYATEKASDIRYIVKITEEEKLDGIYSGIGTSSSAIKINYLIDVFDRVTQKTIFSDKIEGYDPPYLIASGETGFGDLPTDQDLENWISSIFQYSKNDFIAEYQHEDFKYSLPAFYILSESESGEKTYKTNDSSIFINYFSKQKYSFESLYHFALSCKASIEEKHKTLNDSGLGKYSCGDIVAKDGFLYFTVTEDSVLGVDRFSVLALYETDKGFCSVEIAGNDFKAESEYIEIARKLKA